MNFLNSRIQRNSICIMDIRLVKLSLGAVTKTPKSQCNESFSLVHGIVWPSLSDSSGPLVSKQGPRDSGIWIPVIYHHRVFYFKMDKSVCVCVCVCLSERDQVGCFTAWLEEKYKILPTSHWPEPSHVFPLRCKRGWESESSWKSGQQQHGILKQILKISSFTC